LFCMILHAGSRCGGLSYLYNQRHSIAFTLGISYEPEIAICKSDYFQKTSLTLASQEKESDQLPIASEIIFGNVPGLTPVPEVSFQFLQSCYSAVSVSIPSTGISEIFHPPGCLPLMS
jgi:hypothetical protein